MLKALTAKVLTATAASLLIAFAAMAPAVADEQGCLTKDEQQERKWRTSIPADTKLMSATQESDGTLVMLRTPGHLTMLPALRASQAVEPGETTAFVIRHIGFEHMAGDDAEFVLRGGLKLTP